MIYYNFFKNFFLRHEIRKTFFIFILMLIAMVLETFSIGALVPLFTIFSEPEAFNKYNFLTNYDQSDLILYFTLVIFLVFTFKTIFLAFLTRLQANFSYAVMARVSATLFEFYSSPEYSLSSKKDSSQTIRNIIREPAFMVGGILLPLFTILTEVFIIIGIIVLLFIYSPAATAYVLIFLIISTLMLLSYTRPKLRGLGEEVQKHESKRIKQVTYSLSGAKDLVLADIKLVFLNFFKSYTHIATTNLAKQAFYKQIARTLLEYFSIIAICGLIIFLLLTGTAPAKILSLVGIYLVAFFRILPAANKIIVNLNTLSFNNATLTLLSKELQKSKDQSIANIQMETLKEESLEDWTQLVINNITFSHEESLDEIFTDFSLNINKNDFCAITGPSGSGKSTLVDIVLGLLRPQKGSVMTISDLVRKDGFCIPNKQVAYVPQKTFLLDESILANVALQDYFEDKIDLDRLDFAIKVSCLEDLISELPNGINHEVGEEGIALSGGQVQRIGIARAIYRKPYFLILDEATSALDIENEDKIMNNFLTMKGNITLLFISHSENILKYFDNRIKIG